ncbi:MAG: glycosyltransferase family 4 protein [Planctomycetota bacterium]
MTALKVLFAPFYTSDPYQSRLEEELRKFDVEVHRVPSVGTEHPSFVELVRSFRPDLLHLHWLHPWFLAPGLIRTMVRARVFCRQLKEARSLGAGLVWTAHNLVNHDRVHPRIDGQVTRKVARSADGIVVHGEQARAQLIRFCGKEIADRVEVIPLGNHIGVYPNEVGRTAARQRLGVEPRQIMFLFLGRIRPYKGVFELIDAFAEAAPNNPCVLHIAGKTSGEETRLRLKRRCKKTPGVVLHYGFVPDDEIQVYMNAADFVVLPYLDILSSAATVLAASFGKAVIAPRLPCLTEFVHPEGAILYEPGEPRGLAGAIEAAAPARERAEEMGRLNLEVAERNPWSLSAERTARLYRRILDRKVPRQRPPGARSPSPKGQPREGEC